MPVLNPDPNIQPWDDRNRKNIGTKLARTNKNLKGAIAKKYAKTIEQDMTGKGYYGLGKQEVQKRITQQKYLADNLKNRVGSPKTLTGTDVANIKKAQKLEQMYTMIGKASKLSKKY